MLRIKWNHALPPRPRALTRDELSAVFGGCNEDRPAGADCACDCNCHSTSCTVVDNYGNTYCA